MDRARRYYEERVLPAVTSFREGPDDEFRALAAFAALNSMFFHYYRGSHSGAAPGRIPNFEDYKRDMFKRAPFRYAACYLSDNLGQKSSRFSLNVIERELWVVERRVQCFPVSGLLDRCLREWEGDLRETALEDYQNKFGATATGTIKQTRIWTIGAVGVSGSPGQDTNQASASAGVAAISSELR